MISNATPIICLGRINQLRLLRLIFKSVIIPSSVRKEVLIEGKPGYSYIVSAVKEGWLKVAEPRNNVDYGVGAGENAAINLARERKDTLIIDDAFAINVAKAFDVPIIRTTTVVFIALQKKLVTRDRAVSILNQLIENGYYISPREYAILLTKLKG